MIGPLDDLSIPSNGEHQDSLPSFTDVSRPTNLLPYLAIPRIQSANTYILLDNWSSTRSGTSWRFDRMSEHLLQHPDNGLPLIGESGPNRPYRSRHHCAWVHVRIQNRAYYVDKTMLLGQVLEAESLKSLCNPFRFGQGSQLVITVSAPWLSLVIIVDLTHFHNASVTPGLTPRYMDSLQNYSLPGDTHILLCPGILQTLMSRLSARHSRLFSFEDSIHRSLTLMIRPCDLDESILMVSTRTGEYRHWALYVGHGSEGPALPDLPPFVFTGTGVRPFDSWDDNTLSPVLAVTLTRTWPTSPITGSQLYHASLTDPRFDIDSILPQEFLDGSVTPDAFFHPAGLTTIGPDGSTQDLLYPSWGSPTRPYPAGTPPHERRMAYVRVHTTTQLVDRLVPLQLMLHEWSLADLIRPLLMQNNARCTVIICSARLTMCFFIDLVHWIITPAGNLFREIVQISRYKRVCGSFFVQTRGFLYDLLDGMRVVSTYPMRCYPQPHQCNIFSIHPYDTSGNLLVRSWVPGASGGYLSTWRIYTRNINYNKPQEVTYA